MPIDIETAAALIHPSDLDGGHVAEGAEIDGALGTLAFVGAGLGIFAGLGAPEQLGGTVSVRMMTVPGASMSLVTVEVHDATPQLVAWLDARGASAKDSERASWRKLSIGALSIVAFLPAVS